MKHSWGIFWSASLFALLGAGTMASSAPVRLFSVKQLEVITQTLPNVKDEKLAEVLNDERTMWYDHKVLPPVYQDSVPPIIGLRSMSSSLAGPQVLQGGRFRFPFGHTGGTHRVKNLKIINFLRLPLDEEKTLPVVWWKESVGASTGFASNRSITYHWMFPIGTVTGELLLEKSPAGEWVVFEIRTRIREKNQWTPNIYRPFPTAESLAAALTQLQGEEDITPLVEKLMDPSKMRRATLKDSLGTLRTTGGRDVLPKLKPQVVSKLLQGTSFQTVKGTIWKDKGAVAAYAPASEQDFSVVPRGYEGGALEVSAANCRQCHQEAGRPLGDLIPDRVLYGQIWGSDQVFSWHPFDARYATDDNSSAFPLQIKFIQAGILARYQKSKHRSEQYHRLNKHWN